MFNSSGIRHLSLIPIWRRIRQQIQASKPPTPEDSLMLRVLVQALVIVGIIATDVAAGTTMSLWAVPLSILGATWSWYRRRDRNIAVKFLLAIGMLVALGAFFGRLIEALNDTRVVLAELLIQVQVLHSFDLPRRSDLGYSMVIGLILLGVAGTVSQTLAFAPLLLIFLAIALPTLVFDYRSRLGLKPQKRPTGSQKQKKINSSQLGFYAFLFSLVLAIGLVIFAVMPRFPGYQLQTFPVSSPIEIPGDLDGRQIVNPGYGNGEGDGTGGDGTDGPGEIDDTFYYGFNTRMNQNLRGEMKPKVVMRVRSQAEGFWRVLAFDRYTGKGWEIGRNEEATTLRRPTWSYQFNVPIDRTRLGRTQEIVQSYTAVSDLPNIIPALYEPESLYFPTEQVTFDTEGSLRSPLGLVEGLTYTVISEVPYRDRTALSQAPTTYSKAIRNHYLQVPPEISDRVRQQTEEILAGAPNPLTSPYEQALYLAQYLKQNYSIPNDPFGLPFLGPEDDLVETFLFQQQGGYPDHFSTVYTVMLRSIGIPSRLVVGFAPGEFNPFTGLYVVRNTDAYAMTEVYFPEYGWFAFDPIPGHEIIPPSIQEYQPFSVLRMLWRWVAGWLPSPVTGFLQAVFSILGGWLVGSIVWVLRLFTRGWLGLFTGAILLTGLAFLGWLAWSGFQQWRYRRFLAKMPPVERLYQQMLDTLGRQGYRKHPAQTPFEYARALHQHQPQTDASAVEEISHAYVSWRYGGREPNLGLLQQRLEELKRRSQLRRK
ncbi:DUF3488 and DUF4129 domain-containing transglutaminase family protein [Oscillatoria sp. HE19RPO]|uniref:transglutaminase TgpA family protein n=1 Tax=Oscillatoria sp. HE19RPO TaxID=2954806 RepID=UPI0020C28BA9|nr:DUF3488 and DUF4129 domain-containing transglutaminase family protein [Oscillatoria sp. HE19RPO]